MQLKEAISLGADHHTLWDLDFEIPMATDKPVCQGDLLFQPKKYLPVEQATTPLFREILLVGNGGNSHILSRMEGDVTFDRRTWLVRSPMTNEDLTLGVFTVAPNSTALLAHPEHGYQSFGPGTYVASRQGDSFSVVAD